MQSLATRASAGASFAGASVLRTLIFLTQGCSLIGQMSWLCTISSRAAKAYAPFGQRRSGRFLYNSRFFLYIRRALTGGMILAVGGAVKNPRLPFKQFGLRLFPKSDLTTFSRREAICIPKFDG